MNKILVIVDNNCICFSKYNREISSQNLNNTNVINAKNLKFTEEYIQENMDLISTFFNLVVIKFQVDTAIIKDIEIAETAITLINTLKSIQNVLFKEDSSLNYTISSLLLQNKNLKHIECYNLPDIMFYKFGSDVIKTRSSILSISSFFEYNKINTYSDIYNKKTIVVPKLFTDADIEDLRYFFNTNKCLKKVEFKPYNRINLETILKILKRNNLKKIKIIIYEDENTTKEILDDIKFFDKLNKNFNVDIRIKYSKEYKEKNIVKEFNLIFLKYIIIVAALLSFMFFLGYKLIESKDKEVIENNLEEINKVIEEVQNETTNETLPEEQTETPENNYVSSYYQNYTKVYNELLKINDDTVGWITINNTKINYPVVQSSDNDYYLNRAFDKTKSSSGWLFVDYRNNMNTLSKNTIIYGHSMVKGGLMFSTLQNVLNSDWYSNQSNLTISFSVKGVDYKWQVFSIYSIEETTDYLTSDFKNDDSFMNFINKVKTRSINNFNTEIKPTDKILTLSTCYKDNKHRVVLHAKLLNN